MANERKERVIVTNKGDYKRQDRVVEYEKSTQQVIVSRINQLIALFTSVVILMLMMRFALQLIAANAGNMFVNFIYSSTQIMVAPFQSIVGSPALGNGSFVDFGSLFAIVTYMVVAWLLTSLINILFADSGGTKLVSTYEQVS